MQHSQCSVSDKGPGLRLKLLLMFQVNLHNTCRSAKPSTSPFSKYVSFSWLTATRVQTLSCVKHVTILKLLSSQAGTVTMVRLSHLLKGAVGTPLRQNEAELKISVEIDHQNSDFPCLFCRWDLLEISLGNYTSASFWQRITPTAPFKDWYFRLQMVRS